MNSLFFISLLLLHCEMAVGQMRFYVHMQDEMNWYEAQKYCRENYEDLAIITTAEENQRLKNLVNGTKTYGWIGLHKDSGVWRWNYSIPATFLNWFSGQPSNYPSEYCANAGPEGWNDQDCSFSATFFCYKTMILVKENKTWIEAQNYCRSIYKNLFCLTNQTKLDMAKSWAAENQIPMIWSGLRFLDGRWFWISREPLKTNLSLSSCPVQPRVCGARNFNTDVWENPDCNLKLNFICF